MGRLGRSWQLLKTSLHVLRQDKELILLPILSFVSAVIILASFIGGLFFTGILFTFSWVLIIGLLLMYLLLYFVIIFFNTAVIACANIRLNGGDPTISDGIKVARQHLKKIVFWSLISATIGVILQAARERTGMFGRIIVGIIGFAWTTITFFVIPVLIYEDKGMWESMKRSGHLFRETWGETIVGELSFGLFFFLLAIIGFIPIALGVLTGNFYFVILGVIAAALFWVILGAVASALNGIFVAALYNYATKGKLPEPYDPNLLPQIQPPAANI